MASTGGVGGTELGTFLRARRARVSPGDVGLPAGTTTRRTPGLRREEIATLAGISIDYYIRLEQGKETNPSPSVVDSLARTLQLGPDEHAHLRQLAWRSSHTAGEPRPQPRSATVRPAIELLLESLRPLPAQVSTRTGDLLAWNPSGLRLLAGIEQRPRARRNGVRFVFLDPAARALFPDWEDQLVSSVAYLRALAGQMPDSVELAQLIGELLVKSPEFARLWERYDIGSHTHGSKRFTHPEVGEMTLRYQSMQLDGTDGHTLVVYLAEPGTPDHDALILLDRLGQEAAEESAETIAEPAVGLTQPRTATGETTT
jgi:transcriptional regulator with XRE-family HTH domain